MTSFGFKLTSTLLEDEFQSLDIKTAQINTIFLLSSSLSFHDRHFICRLIYLCLLDVPPVNWPLCKFIDTFLHVYNRCNDFSSTCWTLPRGNQREKLLSRSIGIKTNSIPSRYSSMQCARNAVVSYLMTPTLSWKKKQLRNSCGVTCFERIHRRIIAITCELGV